MSMDPITAGIGLVDKFVGKFVQDKDLAVKLQAEARSEEFAGELQLMVGQMEINKIEAASRHWFVASWRPFIGWVCGVALLYSTLVAPLLDIWYEVPAVDTSLLMPVLMGLLGLGGMRTFEKVKGAAK